MNKKLIITILMTSIQMKMANTFEYDYENVLKETEKYNTKKVQLVINSTSAGTGFFIKYKNKTLLVTAAHICKDSNALYSNKGLHKVILSAPKQDTCILSSYQNVKVFKLALKEPVKNEPVYTMGFPYFKFEVNYGTVNQIGVSFFNLPADYYDKQQNTCPKYSKVITEGCKIGVTTLETFLKIRPGNSGGPLLNKNNEVVGIVIGYEENPNRGYVVPLSELNEVLKRLP